MFAKYIYEEQVKLKTARRLDKIKEAIEHRHETIAKDAELQRFVRENSAQVRELLLQLDGRKTRRSSASKLQKAARRTEADVGKLLARSSRPNDANFDGRYQLLLRASWRRSLELYRVPHRRHPHDQGLHEERLRAVGQPEGLRHLQFQGLEKSPQAGAINLMDLVTFRDLYGYLTGEKQAGDRGAKTAAGAKEVRARTPRRSCSAAKDARPSRPPRAARSPPTPRPGVTPTRRTRASRWAASCSARSSRSRVLHSQASSRRAGAERRGHPRRPDEDRPRR